MSQLYHIYLSCSFPINIRKAYDNTTLFVVNVEVNMPPPSSQRSSIEFEGADEVVNVTAHGFLTGALRVNTMIRIKTIL